MLLGYLVSKNYKKSILKKSIYCNKKAISLVAGGKIWAKLAILCGDRGVMSCAQVEGGCNHFVTVKSPED
jgi:hypothetical protein